ncbi:MAG: glycosyltransferase family 2 protein [Acidimicrobiaceae bacterium]|nr:glycosyltransferase family 2 protein [Acidimicrobiaceae bacterium]MDE0607874.1 glycosyltransferase family 2 protein [Acidimicrobiaceae bacterium]
MAAEPTHDIDGTAVPSAATAELDVSIVLPVHNEAPHLAHELDRISTSMESSAYSWELVVVDDGSTDGSAELCKGLPRVRVLQTRRNQGAGAARRIGTEAARGRVVVWSDADMTYPNDRIPELVAELGNGDHIVGARTSEQGTLKIFRVPAKWAIRRLASYLTRTEIPDLNSGFRAFRRDVGLQFTQQLPTGFSCVTTITMAFLMNGYEVRYVPIPYKARAGRSKFHWFRDTSRYVLQVIRMILTYDPLRVALPVTAVLGAVFCAKLGYDIVDKDFRPAANTLLLGFAVLQVLVVGLLADLVVRVNRPTKLLPPGDVEESP